METNEEVFAKQCRAAGLTADLAQLLDTLYVL
jgi:hypothetical protein